MSDFNCATSARTSDDCDPTGAGVGVSAIAVIVLVAVLTVVVAVTGAGVGLGEGLAPPPPPPPPDPPPDDEHSVEDGVIVTVLLVEPEYVSFMRDWDELHSLTLTTVSSLTVRVFRADDVTSRTEPESIVTLKLPLSTVIDSTVAPLPPTASEMLFTVSDTLESSVASLNAASARDGKMRESVAADASNFFMRFR